MLQLSVRRDHHTCVLNEMMSQDAPSDSLGRWLAGRWALVFSHPEDFASYGFEADRWLVYLRNTFDSLRLRAVAIGHDDGSGWISAIGGRFIPSYEANELLPQLQGSAFAKSAPEHFVTILDGSAHARRTMLYRPGNESPSIIGLAETAVHLRERGTPTSVRRILQSA
jgi:hypothetical protein